LQKVGWLRLLFGRQGRLGAGVPIFLREKKGEKGAARLSRPQSALFLGTLGSLGIATLPKAWQD